MQYDSYKISVVIPVYNGARYIRRAVDSVLAQEFPAYEIIIVDDGSTDGTREVVAGYGDKVRYLYQTNAGPGAARNYGVEQAIGNWVAFLDADDIWLPWRLSRQVRLLQENPDLSWCAGVFERYCGVEYRVGAEPAACDAVVCADYFPASLKGLYVWTGAALIRKDILLELGGFRTDIKYGEDIDLWWRIAFDYPAYGYVGVPLAVYFMDVSGSLARYRQSYEHQRDLVLWNMKLASEKGAAKRFEPIVVQQVTDWVRGAKFDQRVFDIGKIVADFREVLPGWFKLRAGLYAAFPRATMGIFSMLSKMNQKYKIRKKAIHPTE